MVASQSNNFSEQSSFPPHFASVPAHHQFLPHANSVEYEPLKFDASESSRKRGRGSWLLGFSFGDSAPGLVRSNSSSSLESYDSTDEDSKISTPSKKGVSFNQGVMVLSVPHASTYSSSQRKKMYATPQEIRANKTRNKKEFRYDGYDWRNATEEWEMGVCMTTGELVHPAHTS